VNLIDIVRDQTRQIQDILKETEKELEEHIRNHVAAVEHDRKFTQEAAEWQPVVSERERTLRDSQLKVQEIQRQIAELQARLRERQKESERADADYTKVALKHESSLDWFNYHSELTSDFRVSR